VIFPLYRKLRWKSDVHKFYILIANIVRFTKFRREKNLKKQNTIGLTIILVLIVAFSTIALTTPFALAHDPPWTIPTYSYLTVSPNPVGKGQTAAIIFWLDIPPPTAGGSGGDRWRNITVDVTKPDGTKQTLGPFTSDPVGSGGTQFIPDQVGTYSFKVNFPGQVLSLTGPTGIPGSNSAYINDTYSASSATATLLVQQEQIAGPASYPLPTGYWTRPIEGRNTLWFSIASNWLGSPQIVSRVQPDGIGPESAHIMWTKPIQFGGVVGGNYPITDAMTYYPGPQYEVKFANPIVINGYIYYSVPLSDVPTGQGVACVDLRTGQQIWLNQNMTSINFGQLYDYETPNQHGVIANGYLWRTSGTTWSAFDPMTGSWLFDLTNAPSGTQMYGPSGEILVYQMNYNARWLALWNNTAAPGELLGTSGTNAWQWRPVGKTINASEAYTWNVTIPSLPGSGSPTIIKVIPDNLILGRSTTLQSAGSTSSATFGTPDPFTFWAISLKPESRGQLLWIKDYPAPANNLTILVGPVDEETGVFTMEYRETMQYLGFNINDGKQIWGPTKPEAAWNYYSGTSGAITSNTVAYGHMYTCGYSGILTCYDMKTGNVIFTYGNGGEGNSTNSGLNTVYGNYPILIGAVADQKVYLFTSEHSPNTPLYEGAVVRCVDANNGTEIWTVDGWSHSNTMAVADGYITYLNLYDMKIYSVGKGPSQTTVTVSPKVLPKGSAIMIEGTVTDQSPGAKDTPAISDAGQQEWMAYIYMQKPKPENAQGVLVHITSIDPNGNYQDIGTATTDTNGNFGIMWNPPIEGQYKITATFEGTKSYGNSDATTYFGVTQAASPAITTPTPIITPTTPSQTTTPTTTNPPQSTSPNITNAPNPTSATPTATYIAIGATIIIIVAAAAALIQRKRK
jgi:outer membrane protein assembly factor BamB